MNQLLNYRFKMKAVGVFFDPFGPFFLGQNRATGH